MTFDFLTMKPLIQAEFDAVCELYPTDMSSIVDRVPEGGDELERKLMFVELGAAECPVHIFGHYPFAFEVDVGEVRDSTAFGVAKHCITKSGVDFGPLRAFQREMIEAGMCSINDFTDILHRTLNYDKLLAVGFKGVYEDCVRLNAQETDPEKKRWREAVMRSCRAMETIGRRLHEEVRRLIPSAKDEDERYNLQRMADSPNVPWETPVTMFDALQAILRTMMFICGFEGAEMNCCGHLDRLIQPYYERDLALGRITREEAYFLVQCFLHRTDMHFLYSDERKNYDSGCSVEIGGCDLQGNPLYNDVTDMVIDNYLTHKMINPKLNARASAASPQAYLERLAELIRSGNNNIVVENDDYIIPMFQRMGLTAEDARSYVGNGCQEVMCNNQMHSRAFVYLNMAKVLLDTLKYARSGAPSEGLDARVYRDGRFLAGTYEELEASFLANVHSVLRSIAEAFIPYERIQRFILPETLESAMMDDCVAKGVDLAEGGARYNHKTFSLVGFGTVCDSLLRLRDAYMDGTLDQLISALDADFVGHETLRLRLKKNGCRFGHSEEADEFACRLADALSKVSRGIRNARGIEWGTSLFTYFQYRVFGNRTGATPDGRRAGEPLSRQMNMNDMPVPTAAALSMAALTQADFHDVGMFDIALPWTADGSPLHRVLPDFIRTCLELKIPVLQTNVADVQTMIEERDRKGTHPDLVVRVCGYSALFGQLTRDMQDEIIARAGA